MSRPRVFVSGVGLVSPLGSTREKTWAALLDAQSGIQPSPRGLEARIFDFSPNGARSRTGDFALLAAGEALSHAGLMQRPDACDPDGIPNRNIGCAVSQSKPIVSEKFSGVNPTGKEGNLDFELLLASFFGWSSEALVSREFNLTGPTANLAAACATGIASIQMGVNWIRSGLCEAALVGASESSLNNFYRAGFEQMGVLVDEQKGAKVACPFDARRNGFVMGEGAAVMVIESERSLVARGHQPLAEVLNATLRQSAVDILRFDSDGNAVASLITQATHGFDFPSAINAHGTGTVFNDRVETLGIKKAFGQKAFSIPVSSTKAATGHLLGAAGAMEAAFAVLSLRDNRVPPTLNLQVRDPQCDLDYVPLTSRSLPLSSVLSLSYGFGGQMGAVLFGKVN